MLQNFLTFIRNDFKTRDQVLLAIIFCGLAAIILGLLLFSIPSLKEMGELIMTIGQSVAEWAGLVFFLLRATITKTKYWYYVLASLSIIAASVVFTILHLPGAMEIFLAGFILLEIVYTVYFVNQNYTPVSGWLKYGWICSWCVVTVGLRIERISELFVILPAILFWLTLYFFLQEKMRVASLYRK